MFWKKYKFWCEFEILMKNTKCKSYGVKIAAKKIGAKIQNVEKVNYIPCAQNGNMQDIKNVNFSKLEVAPMKFPGGHVIKPRLGCTQK